MGTQDLSHRRLLQTLDELEGCEWGPPEFSSHLVTTCHRLRKKPIGEFSLGDLRIMIGQNIGLQFLTPLALQALSEDPLVEADFFPGDLLCAVLGLPREYWQCHTHLLAQFETVLATMTETPEIVAEAVEKFQSC